MDTNNIRKIERAIALFVTTSAAVLVVGQAHSQTANAEPVAATGASVDPSGALEIGDIVVTARRREESLQNVPVTITALSSRQLEQKSLRSTEDLRNFVPGVNVTGLKRDEAAFFVRGQGPGNQVNGQRNFSGVATYFAEVPTTIAGPGVFYDIGSVQILKGPQGTLFGRNTTGGAVLFEPNRPVMDNEGYVQIQGGNYGFRQFNGVINLSPVQDKVALRIAAEVSRRDGFTRSIYTQQRLDGRKYDAVRGSLLLTPTDSIENLTIVDYRYRDQSGTGQVIRAFRPEANVGGTIGSVARLAGLASLGPLAGLTPDQVRSIPLTVGGGASIGCLSAALPGCPTPIVLPEPSAQFGGIAATLRAAFDGDGLALIAPTSTLQQILATQAQIGPRRTQTAERFYTRSEDWGVTNKTIINVTDTITLKNILAFRRSRQNFSFDYDGTPAPILTTVYTTGQAWSQGSDQLTEEFQIQGRIPSLSTEFIAGYYHESEKPGFIQKLTTFQLGSTTFKYPDRDDKSDAIFAHLEVNPTSFLGISGGIRQTWDKRVSSISTTDLAQNCIQLNPQTGMVGCPIEYTGKYSALTYDVTLNLKPTRRTLIYGAYRHGYKSGGFNLPAPLAPPPLPPTAYQTYAPEYVDEFEIGMKADFSLGMPVRLDVAAFRDRHRNRQTSQSAFFLNTDGSTNSTIIVLNNVRTRSQGAEASVTVLPARGLNLSGFASYLDSVFRNTIPGAVTKGQQLANQPKWKYGVSGAYTLPLPEELGDITLSADWAWQSRVIVADAPDQLVEHNPSYGILNARMTWERVMNSSVDFSAFATNLLDKTYILGGFPIAQLGMDSVIYGEPRMYGMSLKYRF